MNTPKLADSDSKKENQALMPLLFIGLIGSTCIHAAVMIAPVPTLWKETSKEADDTIEFIVDNRIPEEKVTELAKEPELIPPNPQEVLPIKVAPMAIALAPETTNPLKEGKDAAAPDTLKPLLTKEGSNIKVPLGGGSIIAKDGIGSGFGNNKIPTGFILGGKTNGNPNGKKDGVIDGIINGKQDGKDTQTSTLSPAPIPSVTSSPPKLECLSCPKPQYRGKEGTPRVTYDISPDGRVTNVRLRQSSGDEQTDRETIEAMSKWQFNPQTIPEGGRTNVRVRVTFEEQGSQFQRQNEERRREVEQLAAQEAQEAQEAEQKRLAEQDISPKVSEQSKTPSVDAPIVPTSKEDAPVLEPEPNQPVPIDTNTSVIPSVNPKPEPLEPSKVQAESTTSKASMSK